MRADALMTVFADPDRVLPENATVDGERVVRYEKAEPDPLAAGMRHIDYGLSVLRQSVAHRLIPLDEPSGLAEVFGVLSRDGNLAAYEAEHRLHEIGSFEGIAALERHLSGDPR